MLAIKYTCDFCQKEYSRKGDLTRHTNRKICGPSIEMAEHVEQLDMPININADNKNDIINALKSAFKSCLNILRDNEGLTGEKALRNMSYFMILKLIEPHFGGEIDIDNYNYDIIDIDDDQVVAHKSKLLSIARFSQLAQEEPEKLLNLLKNLWKDILSAHPATNGVFLKGKSFDVERMTTCKRIIDKFASIDLSNTDDHDTLGQAYEEVIQDIMTGKVLGQFFTPSPVKKMMVNLLNPQVHPDGKIDSCCDPTMGTGGFLITYLRYVKEQANKKNIKLDWEYIKNEGLFGKELEPDTYQLAVSNMLISSGHMFGKLERGDSIREPIIRKFDNILANPPFGIKGLKYNDFTNAHKEEYIPIKTDNAVSLFIQTMIYLLKIDGKCAVVLPDGQDLFSKTNKTLITIREYLFKTCDLKEIIHLPGGVFSNTSIKTCIFYFIKKKEGTEVITVVPKIAKTGKELSRSYQFSEEHQTTSVSFYECKNIDNLNDKTLIISVPIEKLAENSYSLNYAEYIEKIKEEVNNNDIVMKTLGEVCEFLPKSKRPASYGKDTGMYPFFKSSMVINKYTDIPDYETESIIIGDGGEPNINYATVFSVSDHCHILQIKKDIDIINIKFIYYYIYSNLSTLNDLYTGVAIKNISKSKIENITIPIPSIERQQEIVKRLDFIYEKSYKTSIEKIEELKILKNACIEDLKYHDVEMKTLGEVCDFIKTGKNKPKDNKTGTLYPYYGTGEITGYTDEYLFDGNYILTPRNGTIGKCFLVGGRFFPSDHVFVINITNETLMKYIYYYISSHGDELDKLKTGIAIPNITRDILENFKIPIPPIEIQQEIIETCEFYDKSIKDSEAIIERTKKSAEKFLVMAIKGKPAAKN